MTDVLILALLVLNLALTYWRTRAPQPAEVIEPAEPIAVATAALPEPEVPTEEVALSPAAVLEVPAGGISADPRPLDCGHWATSWATSTRTSWSTSPGSERTACRGCYEAILQEYGSRGF